jgi:hypothetical protein
VTASQSSNTLKVTYAGENARADSSADASSVGAASSWTISIDTTSNVLTIDASNASGAAGVGASASAATLTSVIVDPSCAANPIGGSGSITKVSGFIPEVDSISFHAACDGKGSFNGNSYAFDVTP